MSLYVDVGYCNRRDRDASGLTCGYPLPCPHHTYELDISANRITIPPSAEKTLVRRHVRRLGQILDILQKPRSVRRRP